MTDKAVGSGKVTAAMVAQFVIDAVRDDRFYIYSHPKALGSVQTRLEDVMQQRNPTDPLKDVPGDGAAVARAHCVHAEPLRAARAGRPRARTHCANTA